MPSERKQPARRPARGPDRGPFAHTAAAFAQRVIALGIDGAPGVDGAAQVARTARREHPGIESAVDAVIRSHLRLAAVGGFVTGVGGFVAMPAALPANLVEFYAIATRLVATVGALRGYDLCDPSVRTAIMLTLVENDAGPILEQAGVTIPPRIAGTPAGRVAGLVARQLPAPALTAVNKAVAFRLMTQMGEKAFVRLGRAVPFAGGAVGAGVDVFLLRRIAQHARDEFPRR